MERNHQGHDDDHRFGNQSAAQSYGKPESDPNQRNAAKFETDRNEFGRQEDDMDGEMNVSNAGFTGSETSSDLSRDSDGAFTADNMSKDAGQASDLNDSDQSRITNDQSDRNSINL